MEWPLQTTDHLPDGAAGCECGQVTFNLSGKVAGERLTCPWCNRSYRFAAGLTLELLADDDGKPAPPELRPARPDFRRRGEQGEGRADRAASPRPKYRPGARPPEIRGGAGIMVGFMISFNLLALVALHYLRPHFALLQDNRWGILAALGCGHLVGFVAWGGFLWYLHHRRK